MKQLLSNFFNSGSERQQNKKRLTAMVLCATAVLLAVALVTLMIASLAMAIQNRAPSDEDENESGGQKIPAGYTTTTFEGLYSTTEGLLLRIDAEHPYAGTKPTTVLFNTTRPKNTANEYIYSLSNIITYAATEETVTSFHAMITAFYEATKDDCLYISTAYDQTGANQLPGFELGTAIELDYVNLETKERVSIYGVDTYKWIYDNAASYGFVQASNEEGSENVFRYVGAAHATYMKNQNKTLSEYLTILQGKSYRAPLSVSVKVGSETKGYNVYYLSAEEEPVVPTKYAYTVSGDNMGGYIVTVDKSAKIN